MQLYSLLSFPPRAEFIVGFPGELYGKSAMVKTVLVHITVILLPCAPLLCFLGILESSSQHYDDVSVLDVLPAVLVAVLGLYLLVATAYTLLYYMDIAWQKRRWVGRSFQVLYMVVTALAIVYTTNCILWLLVGALLRPNDIFPYAGAMFLLFAQVATSTTRLRKLVALLDDEEAAHEDEMEKEPCEVVEEGIAVKATGKLDLKGVRCDGVCV